jgi:NAD(P)-dependent dehydrogenase (short-subunit alcohol dehydrogenase family)
MDGIDGLRVLITAGAGGIGRDMGEIFASAGARIHVCDVDEAALAETRDVHPDWGVTNCDVADEAQVGALFEEALARFGGLDVLINNAGIAGPTAGVDQIDPDDWRRCIDVDLNGMFYCTRLAVPHLRQSSNASIVCLSSVAGRLGFAYRTPYAAAKWAVVGFMKSLAKELGPDGIRVNAIQPGVVDGPRIQRVFEARADALGESINKVRDEALSRVSLRRMVTHADIANQALFLCSALGANISGQAISVCGNVEDIG